VCSIVRLWLNSWDDTKRSSPSTDLEPGRADHDNFAIETGLLIAFTPLPLLKLNETGFLYWVHT
jgi:hypothetical protein